MIKKVKRVWTTREGKKIRICDMTDSHLENTILFLERRAKEVEGQKLALLRYAEETLNGEMALDGIANELENLAINGLAPEDLWPKDYEALTTEQLRRTELAIKKELKKCSFVKNVRKKTQ